MKKELFVNEMFVSIQGESTFAGLPCFFIRLTGCNLHCSYCDTRYAYTEGKNITIDKIVDKAVKSAISLFEVTGGEPLMQKHTILLLKKLLNYGTVLLETNGTLSIKDVPKNVNIIMDIKCPASNESKKLYKENLNFLDKKDEIKFVVSNKNDFDWAIAFSKKHNLSERVGAILFSPCWNKMKPALLAKWVINSKIKIRLNPLLHKWLWPAAIRGA
jgi:7-carboxy-7-deazaguanine synthase